MGLEIINQKYLSPQILQEYVNLVEDVDTKLNLATKFKCHDVVIDVSPQEIRTLSLSMESGEYDILCPASWDSSIDFDLMDKIVW